MAAAAVPPFYVPRIVLLSDGNPTTGDALQAAAALRGKVEVLTVPLPGRDRARGAALVRQCAGPGAAGRAVQRRGRDRLAITTTRRGGSRSIAATSRSPTSRSSSRRARTGWSLKQTIDAGGLTPITARLKGYQDTLLDNNSDFGLVSAAGKPRVLLVESDPDQAKHLTWALEEQNMQVDVRPPRGARTTWPSCRTMIC